MKQLLFVTSRGFIYGRDLFDPYVDIFLIRTVKTGKLVRFETYGVRDWACSR